MWLAGNAPEGDLTPPLPPSILEVERLKVLVLASFESNMPCVCECFRECSPTPPLGGNVSGEPVLTLLGSIFGSARPGREKLCRLLELLFGSCVKLA